MNRADETTPDKARMWWIIIGVGLVVLITICVAIAYVALDLFARRTTVVAATPAVPATATGQPATAVSGGDPVSTATPTLASTSTARPTTLPPSTEAAFDVSYRVVPMTIDGRLDEWDGIQGVATTFITEQQPSWNGIMDVSSVWQSGWDEQNLYFAITVIDDRHVQEYETLFAYYGDSLELQLDTDIAGDYGPGVNEDDYQYVISPGNFSDRLPGAFRFQGNAEGVMVDAPGTQARVAAVKTADGYIIELSIPWSDIQVTPQPGLSIGAALSVNDNDTPGSQQQQELMLSHVATRLWLDPTSWGTMTLR